MKEPEKPQKPERKPEGENIPDPRYDNAVNKKRCGMCEHKASMKGDWTCTISPHLATGYLLDCNAFSEKPRKLRPVQAKPERVAIPAGVRFIYLGRPRQGERHQGVMTVAYRLDEDHDCIAVGWSFCSPKDAWAKDKGRKLAMDRMERCILVPPYLYNPRTIVLHVAQALMEHRFYALYHFCSFMLYDGPGCVEEQVPGWSVALAQRLKTRRVSGISRLKLFERRSFCGMDPASHAGDAACVDEPAPVSRSALFDLVDRIMAEGSPVIHRIRTTRRPDQIMARMVRDILNLGGKP